MECIERKKGKVDVCIVIKKALFYILAFYSNYIFGSSFSICPFKKKYCFLVTFFQKNRQNRRCFVQYAFYRFFPTSFSSRIFLKNVTIASFIYLFIYLQFFEKIVRTNKSFSSFFFKGFPDVFKKTVKKSMLIPNCSKASGKTSPNSFSRQCKLIYTSPFSQFQQSKHKIFVYKLIISQTIDNMLLLHLKMELNTYFFYVFVQHVIHPVKKNILEPLAHVPIFCVTTWPSSLKSTQQDMILLSKDDFRIDFSFNCLSINRFHILLIHITIAIYIESNSVLRSYSQFLQTSALSYFPTTKTVPFIFHDQLFFSKCFTFICTIITIFSSFIFSFGGNFRSQFFWRIFVTIAPSLETQFPTTLNAVSVVTLPPLLSQ